MILKRKRKTICSLALALVLFLLPLCTPAAAAAYPEGVTAQMASQGVPRSDTLLKNAALSLTGKSLSGAIYGMLYSDETLSGILTGLYTNIEGQGGVLSAMNLDTSPAAVAAGLTHYPSVQRRVAAAADWQSVDLSGASWNVTSKSGFAAAVSAMAIPLNDLLYTLLCAGTYQAGLLTLRGDNGYRDGVMPMLRALGCESIPSDASFRQKADANRTQMLYQIVLSVTSLVDALAAAPMTKLTATLPDLAIFIRDGGLEQAVDVILSPLSIRIGPYLQLVSGSQLLRMVLFLQDPASITKSFADNITGSLNEMMAQSGIALSDIHLNILAAAKGNPGECLVEVLRWFFDTLKLNRGKLNELLAQNGGDAAALTDPLLSRSAGELTFIVLHLMTSDETMPLLYQWGRYGFTPVSVEYTKKLGKKQMKRVLKGIDETIGEFTADFGGTGDLQATLGRAIYASETVTNLAKMLYGALGGGEMGMAAGLIGLPASPAALGSMLPSGYSAVGRALARYESWDDLPSTIGWGVTKGDRASFQRALTAVLHPMRPLLQGLLANDSITLFGALHLPGSNGYNTGVIPLLEALSCPEDSIKTYVDYCKGKGTDAIIGDLLTPILSLVDRLIARPVYTLCSILPNLAYCIQNGVLIQSVQNLLYPLTETLHQYGYDLEKLGMDLTKLDQIDLSAFSGSLGTSGLQLDLSSLDLKQFAGMGTLERMDSKRVTAGKSVRIDVVEADKTAVLITLLRFAVDFMRDESNSGLLSDMLSNDEMPATFQQFSAGIGDRFAEMTTDETIEWLYQLFFRERATKDLPEDDGYEPHVIYEPEPSHIVRNVLLSVGGVLLLAACVLAVLRRRQIAQFLKQRKAQKTQSPADGNPEV